MSEQPKVRCGKFKGRDRKEVLELIRQADRNKNKKAKKKNRQLDSDLKKTYGSWRSVEDIKRSFFLWTGKFSSSPKEKELSDILKLTNLRFYREVSFDLKKRFDFYIPLIDLVIEYDGGQHFKDFKEMENDKFKEALLNKLGIKYIRYNKTHSLSTQIRHDLVYHPVLMK